MTRKLEPEWTPEMEAKVQALVEQGWDRDIAREAVLVEAGWSDHGGSDDEIVRPPGA